MKLSRLAVATAGLALTAGLAGTAAVAPATAGPVDAVAAADPDACSAAERERLEEAGDRFAAACDLPGAELAGITPSQPRVASGQVDRRNMRQLARVPLSGAFRHRDAYGTDLAFTGRYAIAGNYRGFTVYDIKRPANPRRVAQVYCPGAQNDVSVHGDLLILSVDELRSNDTCRSKSAYSGIVPVPAPGSWEGIRVFDIANPRKPKFLTSVRTACGSHTHTLAPSRDGKNLYVYVSSYGPSPVVPGCSRPHDKISVVKVPVDDGAAAEVVSTPVLFPRGSKQNNDTSGCHDITAYPRKNLAAGACMGDGILMDISDRTRPKVVHRVQDNRNFVFWHSATFDNGGRKVVFTDERGGGGSPECTRRVGKKLGADAVYDIVSGKLKFRSYYKMPRAQSDTENCVAHNGSLVPVKGRDIMVQAWYQGGISVWDFTTSRKPRELAHFDRGAISDRNLVLGGSWSAYWYNGHVYSSDITRGLEVFKVNAPWARKAAKVRMDVFNPQSQPSYNG